MFSEAIPLVYYVSSCLWLEKAVFPASGWEGAVSGGWGEGAGGPALREPLGLTPRRRRRRQHCRRCCRQFINKERERAQRGDGRG